MIPMNAVMVITALIAAGIDIKVRRIPNYLTGALALAGIAAHVPQGLLATLLAVTVMLVAFLVGCCAHSAGWFGGGDVKLIAACCGVAGYPGSVALVLYILVAGAFLALVTASFQRQLFTLVRRTIDVACFGVRAERAASGLPYGVAIAAGTITYALSTFVPVMRLSL